jgi:hypothetical protein
MKRALPSSTDQLVYTGSLTSKIRNLRRVSVASSVLSLSFMVGDLFSICLYNDLIYFITLASSIFI